MADHLLKNISLFMENYDVVAVEVFRLTFFPNVNKETFKTRLKRLQVKPSLAINDVKEIVKTRTGIQRGGCYVIDTKSANEFLIKYRQSTAQQEIVSDSDDKEAATAMEQSMAFSAEWELTSAGVAVTENIHDVVNSEFHESRTRAQPSTECLQEEDVVYAGRAVTENIYDVVNTDVNEADTAVKPSTDCIAEEDMLQDGGAVTENIHDVVNTDVNEADTAVQPSTDCIAEEDMVQAGGAVTENVHDVVNTDVNEAATAVQPSTHCIAEEDTAPNPARQQIVKRKRGWTLRVEDSPTLLNSDLLQFQRYWSCEYQRTRPTKRLSSTTVHKITERIRQFMFFIEKKKNLQPSLHLCTDLAFVEEFMTYATAERNIKTGTLVLFLQALLYAGKYLHKDVKTSNDYGDVKCLVELRNLQRQAQTAYERERRMSQQIKPKDELFYWTEVLIIVKKMKSAIENFSGLPQEEARLFMNFLLLLIFTTCNPGRNLDFVKLILWDCRRKSKHMTMEENNYLCLESDGTVKFIFCNYKTSSTYGSQVIDVTNIGYLVSNITRYVDKHRQRLLSGNTHEFLFVQKDGSPFSSSAAFSQYMCTAFAEFSGLRLTTTNMRKACVNFVLNGNRSNKDITDSLARLMRHTPRMQRPRYYTQPENNTVPAVEHLSTEAASSIGLEITKNVKDAPFLYQIVAMVTESSTYTHPDIILGKVIFLDRELNTATLAHLKNLEKIALS
eukprot:gene21128-23202_t